MWIQRDDQNLFEDTPMKSIKTLFVIAALTVSSLAMAEGGGDRTFARMEAAMKRSMDAYQIAQKQGTQPPVAESKANAVDQAKYWTARCTPKLTEM